MRVSNLALIASLLWASCVVAQVVSPMEIKDPAMRSLQQHHLKELEAVSTELNKHQFPYAFYFSRKLDIDEAEQKQVDQRSIRFELYNNRKALEITGNYFASYSDQRVDADHRLRQTYLSVILPILQVVIPPLQSTPDIDVFAVEVSHHVRGKVMGLHSEYAENVVVVIPRALAARVVRAQDLNEQQTLMLDAEVYRSAQPTVLWLAGEKPMLPDTPPAENADAPAVLASARPVVAASKGSNAEFGTALPSLAHDSVPPELRAEPLHDSSPEGLKELQAQYQQAIDKLTQEQGKDAHFVSYAPPTFITFKQGTYLQLALTTTLDAGVGDSEYKLAALAFDRHVAHLVRPVLGYFQDVSGFDGIDFSTTVKISGDNESSHAQAVEFILPLAALHCFQHYDCTGQQLLNTGIILINGERAGVDLQTAETK
jgi:hypothetical protein